MNSRIPYSSILLFFFSSISLAAPQPEDPGTFCESAINQALSQLSTMPGYDTSWNEDYTIEQSTDTDTSSLAVINQSKQTVTLFPSTFARDPNGDFDCLNVDGLCGSVAVGVLLETLYHEFLHACYGPASTPMEEECRNEYRSCLHLAIDYAVHSALCKSAEERLMMMCMNPDYDPNDPNSGPEFGPEFCSDMVAETLIGMCEAMQRLEKKWNNDTGEEVKMACRDGDGCGPPPNSACPTGNSILGNGDPSPYPPCDGTPVLDPCEACDGLTN